jgi:hypothetical protein
LTTAARPADHRARVSRSGLSAAWFGKWHLAGFKEAQGRAALRITSESQRGGFDAWVGYEDNNSQWDKWVHGGTGKDAFQYRLPGYESDELISLFIRYLRERGAEARAGKPRPFFAALSVRARATPTWPRPSSCPVTTGRAWSCGRMCRRWRASRKRRAATWPVSPQEQRAQRKRLDAKGWLGNRFLFRLQIPRGSRRALRSRFPLASKLLILFRRGWLESRVRRAFRAQRNRIREALLPLPELVH